MTDRTVRTLTPEELPAAARLVRRAMLGSLDEDTVQAYAARFEPERTHGSFVDGELVGTARWFQTSLSLPGGGSVPTGAVSAVGVAPTHRRQGHLRALMDAQLRHLADAGNPVAVLTAAEWPIYPRFGYGPATEACGWELDATTARFLDPPSGRVSIVESDDLAGAIQAMHDARWARTPGALLRDEAIWRRIAGMERDPGSTLEPGSVRGAVWHDAAGELGGAVAYQVHESWTRNRPTGRLEVRMLAGATPEAERELWRHLCETDWVSTVSAGLRGVDDPLPLWLVDGRAAVQVDRFDHLWARILDVPAALGARRSSIAGQVVVEVVDPAGYAGGRWRLELGPDGAEVGPSTSDPDVRLPVGALGAAYLGGTMVVRLHEAGLVDEEVPGGAARLGALLASPTAPWCPTAF